MAHILQCRRCRIGIDDDGDGNCAWCHDIPDDELVVFMLRGKMDWQRKQSQEGYKRYPTNQEEAGKPQVKWARVIITEGSQDQIAHHQRQSYFNQTMKMGNVRAYVLDAEQIRTLEEVFPEFQKGIL